MTRNEFIERIEFGKPVVGFIPDEASAANGGGINVNVPALVNGSAIGTAFFGVYVWTDQTGVAGKSQYIYDKCQRDGYAFEYYRGDDRRLTITATAVAIDELFPEADDPEDEILDLAEARVEVDYEEIYAAALRKRLENTGRDSTYNLVCAVAALDE